MGVPTHLGGTDRNLHCHATGPGGCPFYVFLAPTLVRPWRRASGRFNGRARRAALIRSYRIGRFADESSGPRGSIVPLPEGLSLKEELKSGFASLSGKIAFPETVAGGHGDRGGAP